MAVTRKGWRPLTIDGNLYYWRALGRDFGIDVVVITEAAFARGRAQQLLFGLKYGGSPQRTTVTPAVVRRAVELGTVKSPPFTGDKGDADVVLTSADEEELQAIAQKTT